MILEILTPEKKLFSGEIIVDEEALVLIQQGEHVIVPRQFICSFLEELNKTVARNAREAA